MSNSPLAEYNTLKDIALLYLTTGEWRLIDSAYQLAAAAHADQQRKDGSPYIQHPLKVAITLAELRLDPSTIAAALLHDVVEDTPNTITEVRRRFGHEIANLVDGVTKLDKIETDRGILAYLWRRQTDRQLSQQERRVESLRKLLLASSRDIRVVLIKLADRLHNMETLSAVEPDRQLAIAEETRQIYAPIAYRLGIGTIKGRLEDLAFAYLEPTEYESLRRRVKRAMADRETLAEQVKRRLSRMVAKSGLKAEVHARAKHLYSLYRKLARYDNDLTKIHDLVACRIIVPTVEDCYRVLGLIHRRWKPIDGRVKDYIASPKPNGYQSLHTTVKAVDDQPIEIQIRTKKMHEQAEYGVAAHWHYSERKGTLAYLQRQVGRANKQDITWVKQLANWQKGLRETSDLESSMKIDFFGDRIFAYTPKGEVIDLPVGATPIDFAYAIHSEVGNHLAGAKINGKMVRLQDKISSGDTVEVIVQKKAEPKPDWLNETRTSHAKTLIRRALRGGPLSRSRGKGEN